MRAVAGLATAPAPASAPPTDRRINLDSTPPEPQFDPTVAASLLRPDVAVAAFTDRSQGGIQLARTGDGGRSWTAMPFTARAKLGGEPCLSYEPQVAYSRRDDAFYVLLLCAQRSRSVTEAHLLKSVDQGATWTPSSFSSLVVANHQGSAGTIDAAVFPDWVALAVDNAPSSPHYGRVYAGHVRFQAQADDPGVIAHCAARVAYTDQVPTIVPAAAAWTEAPVMPPGDPTGPSAASQLRLAVDDRGGVDVLYANENCNSSEDFGISFTRSSDGGASFRPARHITRPGSFRDNPDPDEVLPGTGAPALISPSITFNPVSGSLHAVYHDFRGLPTSASDVSHQRSRTYGATWSRARTISVTRSGRPAPNDQFLPAIAADPVTGFLHAIWFDTRNDPGNRMVETFQGFSADDGRTWTNADISTAAWDPRIGSRGTPFVGNRNGIAAVGDRIYPVWGDARDPGPVDQGHGGLDVFTNVEPEGSPAADR